jgi:hypothetical protein
MNKHCSPLQLDVPTRRSHAELQELLLREEEYNVDMLGLRSKGKI